MTKTLLQRLLPAVIAICSFSAIFAQSKQALQSAEAHIQTNLIEWELTQADVADLYLQDSYTDDRTGATYLYYVQRHAGIEIYNAVFNITLDKNNQVIHVGNRLISDIQAKVNATAQTIEPTSAVYSAATHFGAVTASAKIDLQEKEKVSEQEVIFRESGISNSEIPVKLCYQPLPDGSLNLAWDLSIDMKTNSDYWSTRVDALTGNVLTQNNFTVYCTFGKGPYLEPHDCSTHSPRLSERKQKNNASTAVGGGTYNVFALPAESPIHGPQVLVNDPADALASPYGWHDEDGLDGADYTITRGNNVHAYLDLNNSNFSSGDEPDGGSDLIFDFPFDDQAEPAVMRDLAVTNLFYMNNMIHDIAYHYGFTEDAGNFQTNNYGRGGVGGNNDFVEAQAQDGGGENNANFATPADGGNGRMQMFLWTRSDLLFIEEPADIAGWYITGTAGYGPDVTDDTDISAEIVEMQDGVFAELGTDGCEPAINPDELAGKIALVDRGGCFFQQKTLYAEEAGAIALILCNFGDEANALGGAPGLAQPTIPTVSIGNGDCQTIRQFIGSGAKATFKPRPDDGPRFVDGDFDNGIIAHEYGHGISNRLTGGRQQAGCLGNEEQMGEGWSDFFTMVTTMVEADRGRARGVGTYAEKSAPDARGIRPFPYSTDMSVNPLTYGDIPQLSVPHGLGSMWCTALMDMYWALTDEYGFDENVIGGTGGNNMAIALVMEGMKLQACSPGMVDGRDGILAADQLLYNGDNQCLIWEVFARRGLGFYADQGSNNIVGDETENFDAMPTCIKELKIAKASPPLANAGDDIAVDLIITNHKDDAATDVSVTDELPDGLTFVEIEEVTGIAASDVTATTSLGAVTFALASEIPSGTEVKITYKAATDPDKYSVRIYNDPVPDNSITSQFRWLQEIQSEPDVSPNLWQITDADSNGDGWSWNVDDAVDDTRQLLYLIDTIKVSGKQPVLRFYHRFDTYPGQHGGIVEIENHTNSNLSGYRNYPDKFFRNGYTGLISYQAFVIPYLSAFSGQSGEFIPSYLDLNEFNGDELTFRFRFGTRITDEITGTSFANYFGSNDGGEGWYMDDFEVMDMFNYDGQACVTSGNGDDACAKAPERGTVIETKASSSVSDFGEGSQVSVYPNPASETVNIAFSGSESKNVDVRIFSISGQPINSQRLSLFGGEQVFSLNVSHLPTGIYFVNIQSDDAVVTEKVIIE